MSIRFLLVNVFVMIKVCVVIGWYGFLLPPIAKGAFYKLLRVQEVYNLPLRERLNEGSLNRRKTFGKQNLFYFISIFWNNCIRIFILTQRRKLQRFSSILKVCNLAM